MFCSKCGDQINQGEKFCGKCGNAVLQEQVQYTVTKPNSAPVVQSITKQPISKKSKILIAVTSVLLVIIIIASILLTNFVLPRVKIQEAIASSDFQYVQAIYNDYFDNVPQSEGSPLYVVYPSYDRKSANTDIVSAEIINFYDEVCISLNSVFVYATNIGEVNKEIINDYLHQNYGTLVVDEYGNLRPFFQGYIVYDDVKNAYYEVLNTYYEILS